MIFPYFITHFAIFAANPEKVEINVPTKSEIANTTVVKSEEKVLSVTKGCDLSAAPSIPSL